MINETLLTAKAKTALDNARIIAKRNMIKYQDYLPGNITNDRGVYPYIKENFFKYGWHFGYWSGIYWLLYHMYGDTEFKFYAGRLNKLCFDVVKDKSLRYSDIGMNYMPSCGAEYKLSGSENAKNNLIYAANSMFLNYYPKHRFILGWEEEKDVGIAHIKCSDFVNIMILRYVSSLIENEEYFSVADNHMKSVLNYAFASDDRIHQSIYFDLKNGTVLGGYYLIDSDKGLLERYTRSSAWSLFGLALNYHYIQTPDILVGYNKAAELFKNTLDDQMVCEVNISENGKILPDTTSASIAMCGFLEMEKNVNSVQSNNYNVALEMLSSLIDNYSNTPDSGNEGLLGGGMFVDINGINSGSTVCGDYYYIEALVRFLDKDFDGFWY